MRDVVDSEGERRAGLRPYASRDANIKEDFDACNHETNRMSREFD